MPAHRRPLATAVALALVLGPALACGASGESDDAPAPEAPAPAAAVTYDTAFWTELCGGPVTRPASQPGERRAAWQEYREMEADESRARACSPQRSLLDAAAGLYRLAMEAAQTNDDPTFVRYIRLGALDLADPLALAKLGQLEHRGLGPTPERPNTPVIERDLGLAFAHVQAAMTIADGVRRATGDNHLLTLVVGGTLGIYDSYETAAVRAEYDIRTHQAEIQQRVQEIVRRYEALHGALPAEAPTPAR
ncbi:MAG: hypothetical protein H6719_25690 [Sandaracinaceae bacterium]|nr:hypothetical protein [Sandaracinaceae bacterium]